MRTRTKYDLKQHIQEYPDFPKPGVLFKDINPLLRHHFHDTLSAMIALLTTEEWGQIDAIAGIESRGFILGAGIAAKLDKPFIPIRKSGKLPGPVDKVIYQLEYGEDALEMSFGSEKIALVDDVLATGGTLLASTELAAKTGYDIGQILVLMNLVTLNSSEIKLKTIKSVIEFN